MCALTHTCVPVCDEEKGGRGVGDLGDTYLGVSAYQPFYSVNCIKQPRIAATNNLVYKNNVKACDSMLLNEEVEH